MWRTFEEKTKINCGELKSFFFVAMKEIAMRKKLIYKIFYILDEKGWISFLRRNFEFLKNWILWRLEKYNFLSKDLKLRKEIKTAKFLQRTILSR